MTASTAEAEYVAAAEVVKESLWLRRAAGGMGEDDSPVTIHEYDQACIAMPTNPATSSRTKHVDVAHHLARDCAERGEVILEYVPSNEQVADGFTKPLPAVPFRLFHEILGVREVAGGGAKRS